MSIRALASTSSNTVMSLMRIGEKPEIARLPLFRDMDDAMRERVLSGSFLQVFPPQLTLFERGQQADFLHVLVDGLVELYVSGTGRDTTMKIVEPVTSFILAAVMTDLPYLMSARTLTSSRVLLVPAALMREVIRKGIPKVKWSPPWFHLSSRYASMIKKF